MVKTVLYTYLGTNGTITSPVHLEDIYYIRKVRLEAEANKVLSKDGGKTTAKVVTVPEEEVELWKEMYSQVNKESFNFL